MIDNELVVRKMVLIMEDMRALEPLARKPLADYLASPTDETLAERYLERMIGRLIDVNYHVLTESGQPPPERLLPVVHGAGRDWSPGARFRRPHRRLGRAAQPHRP